MHSQKAFIHGAARLIFLLLALSGSIFAASAPQEVLAGHARLTQSGEGSRLENQVIGAKWSVADDKVSGVVVTDKLHGTELRVTAPFAILLQDGTIFDTGNLRLAANAAQHPLTPQADASRMADRLHGEQFDFPLESRDRSLNVTWSMVLLDGSTYLRQLLTITAVGKDIPISRVELIDLTLRGAHVSGSVQGSPIVAGDLFLGFEHPLSKSKVTGSRATAWMDRDFLAYLERERAHPYRTFLHYNSWYDLGYFTPYDQNDALDRVNTFGRELTQKRGVRLDSFLFDDGWDNHK